MSAPAVQDSPVVRLTRQPDFLLGASKVRPSTLEVERGDGREALEPRVMQVLVALYRVHPEVISRDDLIAQCWNGRTVGEDALNRVIGRLRRLSKADEGKSFTIATIARVGYRLLPAAAAQPSARRPALAGPPEIAAMAWRALLALRHQSPESLTEAMGLYEHVVAASPQYADGWGGLALTYACVSHNMATASAAMRLRSLAAVRRAEALDPYNALTKEAKTWLSSMHSAWLDAQRAFGEGLTRDAGDGLLAGMSDCISGVELVLETADLGPGRPRPDLGKLGDTGPRRRRRSAQGSGIKPPSP